MNVRQIVKVLALVAVVFSFMNFSVLNDGDTRKEALSAYNAGSKLAAAGDAKAAIDSLELAIEIAEKLDSNGLDIIERAAKKLPGLYYNIGAKSYKAKNYGQALTELEAAKVVAEKYNDEKTLGRIGKMNKACYYKQGSKLFKSKDFDGALTSLNSALELDPEYLMALYYKGRSHKELKQYGEMETSLNKAIEVAGDDEKKAKIVGASKGAMATGLKAQAKEQAAAGNHKEAIATLEKAITFTPEDEEKRAGYYFEIGKAYQKLNQKSKACEAYGKAAVGKYKENAEYKINTDLKCNG